MAERTVIGLFRFREIEWQENVEVHLRKARNPCDVVPLIEALQSIVDAGPDGAHLHQLITRSVCVETNDGSLWFAVVSVGRLVAIVQWDRCYFVVLSVIDLDRLARRRTRRQCYIINCEPDPNGRRLPITLFVNFRKQIVCCALSDVLFRYDPWGELRRSSAGGR
jgi:hypothetical protein